MTSSRAVQLDEVPSVWIDRLLVATLDLPHARGEGAVVDALVDAVAAILPSYAVGVCFVGGAGAPQRVIKRTPAGTHARSSGVDPTRIFPEYARERSFAVSGAAEGSTLHLAGDDLTLDDDRAPPVHVALRAATALARALEHARAYAAAEDARGELRTLESHVIQAEKLASFGQIAAGLVHELNNPLTSIVAYTDFLIRKAIARGEAVEPDDMERLRRISESANRMLRFTRDLVTYARPSGELAVPVVLHTVIEQALAFCEHVIAEAGAKVERRFGQDVLTVRGMPEQLTQVFVNLVTNACHALPKAGGRIVIGTELLPATKRVRITVEDNGHGISEEHLPHVFAPFYTTKRDGRGTGLGLSIVKSIVESHDGTIHVDVDAMASAGTRFVVELPVGR